MRPANQCAGLAYRLTQARWNATRFRGGVMTQMDTVDFEAIKERQRMGWEAGDYPRVGNTLQLIAERLVEAADVHAGQRVLDVACGQGNAAIAAARRFADSTGVDYAANLLAQGRERAAAELVRVTRAGGKIALASWTPEGLVGVLFKTIGTYAPPPAGVRSPMLW